MVIMRQKLSHTLIKHEKPILSEDQESDVCPMSILLYFFRDTVSGNCIWELYYFKYRFILYIRFLLYILSLYFMLMDKGHLLKTTCKSLIDFIWIQLNQHCNILDQYIMQVRNNNLKPCNIIYGGKVYTWCNYSQNLPNIVNVFLW